MYKGTNMTEIDSHFDAYEHLKHLPREQEALHMLRKVASSVKPIMRKRGWRILTLAEFLPEEPQLLGLNINRTQKVLIRLRYHHDSRQFLPFEQVIDTLLHELSHIVWGPHDHNFNNLWNELRDEHQSLLAKGYTGEGFLSAGHKLGGKRIPLDEMRRQARAAAEKRKAAAVTSGGHRLGGDRPTVRGVDMRKIIADAATRRNSIMTGCASGSTNANELNSQAEQGGFRTKAEEDDANDLAIAQALQELMEEEEMAKLCAPSGEGGLAWDRENGLQFDSDSSSRNSTPAPNVTGAPKPNTSHDSRQPGPPSSTSHGHGPQLNAHSRPISRLVREHKDRKAKTPKSPSCYNSTSASFDNKPLPPPPAADLTGTSSSPITISSSPPGDSFFSPQPPPPLPPQQPHDPTKWTCPQCTLLNPLEFLACDACGGEQPPQPIPPNQQYGTSVNMSTLPKPPPASALRGPGATPFEKANGRIGWNCLNCGTFMEQEWWTCSLCGEMKLDS